MRKWLGAALSALPIFLFGCVVVLIGFQVQLANLQAATEGYGWSARQQQLPSSNAVAVTTTPTPSQVLQQIQQLQQQQQNQQQQEGGGQHIERAVPAPVTKDTLVLYIYNEDDPAFKDNFHYFLLAGVQENSRCSYVVVVQLKALKATEELPALPAVTYLYYPGSCLEWGMVGWALRSEQVDWQPYKYFVFVSSAVRGPFMPSYLDGVMHWTQALIGRLSGHVKLVGPVISCTPAPSDHKNLSAPWATNPHIPLHAAATDRVGLDVLMRAGVLDCHTNTWQEKYASELRASSAMLEAGYGIDCLLIRYQGVDWSQPSAHSCNRAWDPTGPGDYAYDGIALDPMEVMFARVNTPMLKERVPSVLKALKYTEWALAVAAEAAGLSNNNTARVADNTYLTNRGMHKLSRILTVYVRGQKCFDVEFFVEHNRDFFGKAPLKKIDLEMAWKFFVYIGQFEDRPFRFTCDANYTMLATPAF